jgi:FADH2 O2-dependent halogenase
MIHHDAEVAVLGAGFAGCLTALILRQLGRDVVLVEKGSHPRFALGESSTPLANLAIEEISRYYHFPWLAPVAEYGSWKQTFPNLPVGLKRGFSFVQHQPGKVFEPDPLHPNELLVTASPRDEVADTHWLRADFDHFLVKKVIKAGIPYFDRCDIRRLEPGRRWKLTGERMEEPVAISALFLIDASGPGGLLAQTLDIDASPRNLLTDSWSVYSHFQGVDRWDDVLAELGDDRAGHPYPVDDAALHHMLKDCWIWVLRFENGITSAGVLFDGTRTRRSTTASPEEEWRRVLATYPSLARQFRTARPVLPWFRTGRLQRRARRTAGENWAMLASAAYTLDALFSTGNAHVLHTIQRLARAFARPGGPARDDLTAYDSALQREINFVDALVHGAYRSFGHFSLMVPYTMYYFAGAIDSEHRRRHGQGSPDDEFLSSHRQDFRAAVLRAHEAIRAMTAGGAPDADSVRAFERQAARDIAPINVAGLCDPARRNLYPYVE